MIPPVGKDIECQVLLYRALLRRDWIDIANSLVTLNAFFLRKTDKGLSVSIASECTPQDCAAQFSSCRGVASLHAGRVKDLGLSVELDSKAHAEIRGVPHRDEDPDKAEWYAGRLAEQARIALVLGTKPPTSNPT